MYKLVISDDEGKTTVVPLVRNEITIGRKEGNTIRLTERNVSRKHARLARTDGQFVIHDLESYNGVRINGRRIDQDTRLEAGDKVVIGDYVLALQNEEADELGTNQQPQAAAIPPARLVMLTPPAPGAEFALPEGAIKIGRAEDLDVWVNHRSISREHAEIRREGSQFQVVDLESANGVRLNNEEIAEATLSPGDELELGQVRFRFVGEGERYSFEADRTVQMDALVMPIAADPRRKRNTLIGVGIVVTAIVVAGLLAITDTERPTPEPVVTPIQEPPVAENTGVEDSAQRFLAATEACVEALRNEDFVAANAAAERALAINADSAMAADCQRRAQGRVGAQQQFEEGVEHLENGRVEDAWMAFDSLPTDSEFRARPEVEQARDSFVQHYYQAAQTDAEAGERESALRQLDQVFNHSEEDSEVYQAAEELQRDLQAQARNERNPRNMRRVPRQQMVAVPDMTQTNSVMDTTPTSSSSVSGREVMRDCNFNNRCVIQRLNRAPTTRESLPFLIEAYKAVGNTAAAQRLIQDYLRRYPTGPHAAGYRRQVSAQN